MTSINPIVIVRKRLDKYLNASVGDDVDNKFKKLKYTVIRQYFSHLVKTLKDHNLTPAQDHAVSYLKKILHAKIINDTSYEFPDRIPIILNHLEGECARDPVLSEKIAEWDQASVYF